MRASGTPARRERCSHTFRTRLIIALGAMMNVVSASGLRGQEPVRVEVTHRQLSKTKVGEARLSQKRDVWIAITDANALIYTYTPGATLITEDRVARAEFERLLAGAAAPRARAPDGVRGASTPEQDFVAFANSTLRLAEILLDRIESTEQPPLDGTSAIAQARDSVGKAVSSLGLGIVVSDTGVMLARLRALYGALDAAAQTRNDALNRAATLAIPGVVFWRRELVRVPDGPQEILFEYPGTGEYLVELTVANRLGDAYRPRHFVGSGADVVVVKPRFPTFQVSFGMGGLFGQRTEAELVKVSAAAAATDTFEVRTHVVDRLSLLPSTYFAFQRGIGQSPWTLGATLGVGLQGDDIQDVGQATDLMALFTAGYEWLRLSIGGAYTSEITAFGGVFRGAGADSTRTFTIDPNALQRANRTRKGRLVLALHMTR